MGLGIFFYGIRHEKNDSFVNIPNISILISELKKILTI